MADRYLAEQDMFDLQDVVRQAKSQRFAGRVRAGAGRAAEITAPDSPLMLRQTIRDDGREVEMLDRRTGTVRRYLMFGSNNYLGLASHPEVQRRAQAAIGQYGVGTPGPPHFNGYSRLHRELEERLASLKAAEDAILFPTGYSANVGITAAVATERDIAVLDQGAHASFWDGVRMARVPQRRFRHNDAADLEAVLNEETTARDRFVIVEGVYSMDGDAAPLDRLVPVCRRHEAILVVDDAHATGVLGARGRGAAEHFGVEGEIDITIGTLGKAFGAMGAFAAASREIVAFLRFFARSYMFSTALPPMVVAAVLAGLDVVAREPELAEHLRAMVRHAAGGLRRFGLVCEPVGALVAVRVPEDMDVKKALAVFEREAIFINYAVFPAVPVDQQRFRVSFSARHSKADIDRLVGAFEEVWTTCRPA